MTNEQLIAASRVDLTEPRSLLATAEATMDSDRSDAATRALAWATMGLLAYHIAVTEMAARYVEAATGDDRR